MKGDRPNLARFLVALLAGSALVGLAGDALAQQQSAPANIPSGTPTVLPRPDFQFQRHYRPHLSRPDPAQFPQPVQAPKGAPNIVLILLDDAGFGQFSTFGGGVPSPTMDRLAKRGPALQPLPHHGAVQPVARRPHHRPQPSFLRFRDHYRNSNGLRRLYAGCMPRQCGTVGEVLRQNGYMTAWIGKNHNTPPWETSAGRPVRPLGQRAWASTTSTASTPAT